MSLSSKTQSLSPSSTRVLKYGSWCTSAGEADWYVIQTVAPEQGDPKQGDPVKDTNYASLSGFLVYKVGPSVYYWVYFSLIIVGLFCLL